MSELLDPFDLPNEALKDYVSKLLLRIGKCESVKTKSIENYSFLSKILNNHPEKERKGVTKMNDIMIHPFDSNKPVRKSADLQVFVVTDDKIESISWLKSIDGIENSVEQKLYRAMRYSVKNQIILFKKKSIRQCEICSKTNDLTADHLIKFRDLFQSFIKENPKYPKLYGRGTRGEEIFRVQDKEYELLWQRYHQTNAKLRVLCYDCNQSLE